MAVWDDESGFLFLKKKFKFLILKNKTFHYLGNEKRYQVFLQVLDVTWQ